jgi:hypothetical protein
VLDPVRVLLVMGLEGGGDSGSEVSYGVHPVDPMGGS